MEFEYRFKNSHYSGTGTPKTKYRKTCCIPDEYVEELLELRAEGMSYEKIGRKFCCSGQCIKDTIDRHKKKNPEYTFY